MSQSEAAMTGSPDFECASPPPGIPLGATTAQQEIVQEIAAAVGDRMMQQLDSKLAALTDNLWLKGQKAMQQMKQQQTETNARFESGLNACQESQRSLERDNAQTRARLDKLCVHLYKIFAHMQPPDLQADAMHPSPTAPVSAVPGMFSPFLPGGVEANLVPPLPGHMTFTPPFPPPVGPGPLVATGGHPQMDLSASLRAAEDAFRSPDASPKRRVRREDESPFDSSPPPTTPKQGWSDLETADSLAGSPPPGLAMPALPLTPQSVGTGAGSSLSSPVPIDAAFGSVASPVRGLSKSPSSDSHLRRSGGRSMPMIQESPTFMLTLRRANNVPLGLDVGETPGQSSLTVEAVRPGGAVEAWNRQCVGDAREIRAGDRIVSINDVKEADAMREECKQKLLLRMTVERGTEENSLEAQAQVNLQWAMRADADEFVPQASSWVE